MKELKVLILCLLSISTLADENEDHSYLTGSLSKALNLRLKRSYGGGHRPVKPVLGGHVNPIHGGAIGGGLSGIGPGGFPGAINPGHGGIAGGLNPGLGGLPGAINPGLGGIHGGVNPGHGAILEEISPAFGGHPGAINPGLGVHPGAINPGLGGHPGAINPGPAIIGGGILPGNGGIVGLPPVGSSQTCRRWCRTPEKQAYCCEQNHEPETLPIVKPGQCPPVRPQCPPVRSGPPQTCSNDSKCFGVDKCCFDRCLEEHVCKPPQNSGGFPYGR
ncbi:elastin-like [Palaemon carinicauda]|uniref:elastin-like n=1 Tax=Palaemon carinicauda TaxID=392227 RepID=UPI0035B5E40A